MSKGLPRRIDDHEPCAFQDDHVLQDKTTSAGKIGNPCCASPSAGAHATSVVTKNHKVTIGAAIANAAPTRPLHREKKLDCRY